ncbi:RSN1 [Fusarium mundagurra]|uniref:RSN1 n=1 Tax=Fusarium mundagurra TaxID=1567541 RepID=A0A8H5XWE7_9HYPO|nr:RSN1 [Fusarium mundagurra]
MFLVLRTSNRWFYAPRTYIDTLREHERSPELPNGFFRWMSAFWKIPDAYALRRQSLDSYLFIRFLRVCCTICFVILCVTWPVLLPLNATGGNGRKQIEVLSYSNINIEDSVKRNRLYAHCFVAWVVYGFVMYAIMREFFFYINLRQAFLSTPQFAKRISSRTVLFTSVPKECLDEDYIHSIFPGSARIWIAGDTKQLDRITEERDSVAVKLEEGEIELIRQCNKERIKFEMKRNKEAKKPTTRTSDSESGNTVTGYRHQDKRPTHRTGPFGVMGTKVDTTQWCRRRLKDLLPEAQSAQDKWLAGEYEKHTAFFVEFSTQHDAQVAFLTATHHLPLQISPRFIGIQPNEVIWKSLNYSWWQVAIRRCVVYAIITSLVVFWVVPVTVVSVITQVNLLKSLPGLTWLQNIPHVLLGAVSGLLPSIALSILMSLVPQFIRSCARWSGCVSLSQAELFTQKAYFIFQVLQVFLVQTLSNSFISSLVAILRNPNNVFSILSSSVPTASNFYISFFIVQGLSIATSVVTQVFGFIMFTLSSKLTNNTPRMIYDKWTTLRTISLGGLMPIYTNMAVISIIYSIIAPFLLLWSTISMGLFYLAYRYNVLYVVDTDVDTCGLIYPQALKQLLFGVYVAEMCLVGMFIVSKAVGPTFLMIVFLALTVLYHVSLVKALNPLLYTFPLCQFTRDPIDQNQQRKSENVQVQNGARATSRNGRKSSIACEDVSIATGEDHTKTHFITGWLRSRISIDYAAVERLVRYGDPKEPEYPENARAHAYYPPSVTSKAPYLWIPGDDTGISNKEMVDTGNIAHISNKGCHLNRGDGIEWETDGPKPLTGARRSCIN